MVREIVRRTDGVPLFVEELTKMLLESGPAQHQPTAETIPVTPQDLLLARLDRLGSAKLLAHWGALLGREFRQDLLEAVAGLTEFLCCDYKATGFPEASFEVVWALESVCHAPDLATLSREFFRVLAPGGRLVVADGFAARARFEPPQQALMDRWLRGWCVAALATVEDFSRHLAAAGFADLHFEDATANVLPSSRRLYRCSRPIVWLAALLEWCGPGLRTRAGNIVAAHGQYVALRRGLWRYGMVCATKPA